MAIIFANVELKHNNLKASLRVLRGRLRRLWVRRVAPLRATVCDWPMQVTLREAGIGVPRYGCGASAIMRGKSEGIVLKKGAA